MKIADRPYSDAPEDAIRKLKQAAPVISPYQIGAVQIAQMARRSSISWSGR